MNRRSEPFWHWPGWGHLGHATLLGLAQGAWFAVVYGGADWFTARRTFRVRVHLDAELALPFVPALVVVYLSIYLLFWAAPFILRSRRELRALTAALAAVTLFSGICFVLLPVEPAFPQPGEMGIWSGPVWFAKRLALRHNLVPSLHVALSVVCIAVFAWQARPLGQALLWGWAGAIGLSTLLLHQHYVLDVLSGFAVAGIGVRVVYTPWAGTGAGSSP